MKTITICLCLLLTSLHLFSQETLTTINSSETLQTGVVGNYKYDIQELKKRIKDTSLIFNNKMLNVFFASEVGSFLSNSSDLSLQRSYAVINTSDNSLFLGGTFELERKKEKNR